MTQDASGYGLWTLVVLNSALFLMFAFSFFKRQTGRDWCTFGAFAAFIVALFVEIYGLPLSSYLLSGWLQTKYPSLDLLSHNTGHLWSTLLGFLLQWPTLLTLLMFPILMVMYGRLAITEEAEMRKRFGADFEAYVQRTPRFFPKLSASIAAEQRDVAVGCAVMGNGGLVR